MKVWLGRWGPALLIMAVIFTASSIPGSRMPVLGVWDALAKKTGHMMGYALLTASLLHALHKGAISGRLKLAVPVCLAILYAISDEWHQSFVPGRNASPWDVVIDAAGSFIALAVWLQLRRRPHLQQ